MNAGVQAQGRACVRFALQFGRQFGMQLDAQFAHPLVQVERGVNGAPAIVFARDRVAEHRQQTIALHPHHHAAMLGDVHLVGAAQFGQQGGVVLGLHRPGQFGRMREVGEQQGDIAPTGVDRLRFALCNVAQSGALPGCWPVDCPSRSVPVSCPAPDASR